MGRSRRRARTASGASPTAARPPRRAKAAPTAPTPTTGRRRALAVYLAGALVLGAVFLLGTLGLGGTLAPWIVLLVVAGGALAVHAWTQGRLVGHVLDDDDRLLQTMAAGLLILIVAFAAITAVVLTVA